MPMSPLVSLGLSAATGYQQAKSKIETDKQAKEDRALTRQIAQQRADLGKVQLAKAQFNSTPEALQRTADTKDLELQQLKQKVHAQDIKTTKTESFSALDRFVQGKGDVAGFNSFLKDNKDNQLVQQMYQGVVRVDPVNTSSEEDRKLLVQAMHTAGTPDPQAELDALDGKTDGNIDWNKVRQRYVTATMPDGSKKLTDMLSIAARSGYGNYARKAELEQLKALANIQKAQKGPAETSLVRNAQAVAEAKTRIGTPNEQPADQELVKQAQGQSRTPVAPTEIRVANAVADAKVAQAEGKATPAQLQLIKDHSTNQGGTKAALRSSSEEAIAQFDAKYKDLSVEDLRKSPEAMKTVRQIGMAYGITDADYKQLQALAPVAALANKAASLKPGDTGIVDSRLNQLFDVVSDVPKEGTAPRKAYGAIMSAIKHSLYGAAQSEGELRDFHNAYGSLGSGQGAVVEGLKNALIQVHSKLNLIVMRYPKAIVKAYIGVTSEQLTSAINKLQVYSKLALGEVTPAEAKVQLDGKTASTTDKPPSQTDMLKAFGVN